MKALFWLMAGLIPVAASSAATWTGPVVNSSCYSSLQQNTSADEGFTGIDLGGRIRYCAATVTTTSFAIVQPDGSMLRFDGPGNEKALDLMYSAGIYKAKARPRVIVSGKRYRNTLQVNCIVLTK